MDSRVVEVVKKYWSLLWSLPDVVSVIPDVKHGRIVIVVSSPEAVEEVKKRVGEELDGVPVVVVVGPKIVAL